MWGWGGLWGCLQLGVTLFVLCCFFVSFFGGCFVIRSMISFAFLTAAAMLLLQAVVLLYYGSRSSKIAPS